MEDKELEKILQEKADKTEIRKFSKVWKDIKGEIEQPKPEKRFRWKRWLPMMLSSAVLILCIALSPIVINALKPSPPDEIVFYTDDLSKHQDTVENVFNGLNQANIACVDMSKYYLYDLGLYYTEEMVVKGAFFVFSNDNGYAEMSLYDKSVDLGVDIDLLYDSTYKIGSTIVHYKVMQESGVLCEYTLFTVHNKTQYVMEYTGEGDKFTDFLQDFFG